MTSTGLPTRITVALVALALLAAACGTSSVEPTLSLPPPDLSGIAADLADARQRWAAAGIGTYHYQTFFGMHNETTAESRCGMDGRLTVQVLDGSATEARDGFSGCLVDLDDPDRPPLTVEDWFALIESTVAEPGADAHEMYAAFSDTGVPITFFVASDTLSIEGGIGDLIEGVLEHPAALQVLADLGVARARWDASGVKSYRYRIEVGSFGRGGRGDVIVKDSVVFEALWNDEPPAEFAPEEYFTVPGLFAAVERFAYSDGITVTYHAELGYPIIIDADPVQAAIHDEQVIAVTDFEVLDD